MIQNLSAEQLAAPRPLLDEAYSFAGQKHARKSDNHEVNHDDYPDQTQLF